MAKRTKRRRRENARDARPSLFFIIAFALGLIFLAILFLSGIGRSTSPALPGAPATQT